ncbi:hypothetical protein [Arthrobacter sp. Bz4]|uniref:hypothetical protein n=1 Tax=Arthrobacter sp. Bz4 TaxID=2171979 RepID=UPI0014028A16|nr:hypothetical protein [Arthrobacter sp. Bz4]
MTGYLIHPPTGYLIEPGTGNLIDPSNYFYTNFRWIAETGAVVDLNEETEEPEETPAPEESESAEPEESESPEPTPTPTRSATPSPSPSTSEAAVVDASAASEETSIGSSPITRGLVIIGLVGLGVLYYAKLRGGNTARPKPGK